MTAANEGETFLQRQKRIRAEAEALERGVQQWAKGQASAADIPTDHPRARRWVEAKVTAQLADIASCPEGERNELLNVVSYSMGRLCPKWLDPQIIGPQLVDAGLASGLEHAETLATVRSGLKGGMDDPRDPPVEDDLFDAHGGLGSAINLATGEILPPTTPAEPVQDAEPSPLTAPLEVERTSWWPRDIALLVAGQQDDEAPPAFLARTDGHRLLYSGKVNALIGESESGKSWIGLLAVHQALQEAQRVLILDFEDTAAGVIGRLRLMGATEQQLALLVYISPDETLGAAQQRDLAEVLTTHKPHFILFDGVNAAMTMMGLNLLDNMDVTKFSMAVLRPLKRTGACVTTIDHVTKNKEGRGSYAIGAQAKRADIDGCALLVEVAQPFGRGMIGRLRLTVSKDRPGQVRAVSSSGKGAGTVTLISDPNGDITASVEAPDLRPASERPKLRPTHLMERVSLFLEAVDGDALPTKNALKTSVTGKGFAIAEAADRLVEEGYVERIGSGLRSRRSYREAADLSANGTGPEAVLGGPRESGSRTARSGTGPPPYKGDRDRLAESGGPNTDEEPTEQWWQK